MTPRTLTVTADIPVEELALSYSFREKPLVLRASAAAGDEIRLILTDARAALYVNGELCDEEWPVGELTAISPELAFTQSESIDEPKIELRRDISAEELRRPGVNVGDCMPFTGSDGKYHLYWLYDRHHHCSKWGLGAHQWAHASTADLVSWDEHTMAVAIDEQYEGSICTGSTIEDGVESARTYCWFAVRMSDGSPARITSSVSEDGENFVKSGKFFTLPERYHQSSARDPKVVRHDGKYHMLVTTTLLASGKGCLAHLVSEHADMSGFTDLGPIIEWSDGSQPECPDYFELDGRFYLIWSIGGRARYAYSERPFGEGGWTIPEENVIDCGSVPKAAILPATGELVFTGFVGEGGYAGHIIMKKARARDDGTLELYEA